MTGALDYVLPARLLMWLKARLWSDAAVAVFVGLAVVVLLVATADQGFVRDEGYYFRAAREYHAWFEELWRNLWNGRVLESFSGATVSRSFAFNWEHPGFVKILAGWTWKVFHVWLGVVSDATGFRLAVTGRAFLHHFGSITQKSIKANLKAPKASLGDREYYRKKYGLTWFIRHRARWREKALTLFWRAHERARYGCTLLSSRHGGVFIWR